MRRPSPSARSDVAAFEPRPLTPADVRASLGVDLELDFAVAIAASRSVSRARRAAGLPIPSRSSEPFAASAVDSRFRERLAADFLARYRPKEPS